MHKQRHTVDCAHTQTHTVGMCVSTDLIVNNKGSANLEERWMSRKRRTESFLSALLSKDCQKGKEE